MSLKYAVAISNDLVLIGARHKDLETHLGGLAPKAGAAYVYKLDINFRRIEITRQENWGWIISPGDASPNDSGEKTSFWGLNTQSTIY